MPTLRIVSVNDVYSLEHLPRLKTLVVHCRNAIPADATLVVLAGDFVAPSLLSSLDCGRAMVDCLNDVGVTHVVFGNHEDDIPTAELHRRIEELGGAWLSTNLDFDAHTKRHDVIAVGALRVGLVGVVMTDRALYRDVPFGGAAMQPANDSALREAAELVKSGCAAVVAVTHQPMDDDRELARTGKFPAIIGGHEHVPLLERVGETWIVKAGTEAIAAAITEIVFTDASAPPTVTTRLEPVADYPEDPELRARVDAHMRKVEEIRGACLVVLAPGETLSSVGTRHQQTSLGTLLCSRIRDALGAEACLFNGGGIRGSADYKDRFTYADLETEIPFANEIVVVRMPGRTIRDAVAASRARESGAYLQIDDALRLDTVEDDRDYRVATVRNLLEGMDHIEPLVRFAKDFPDRIPPQNTGRDVKHVLVDAFAVQLWRKLGGFDDIDENRDGVITEPEIAKALARVTQNAPSHVAAQLLLHAIDANADSVITPSELERIGK
ncbi:MAG TPA: 5'-nucleotidase C-terminal domain-containing protein [Polyangiaceae bacterium]